MGTTIRPVLSKKNKYWISRHRYYELKHFCMQYYEWKRELEALDINVKSGNILVEAIKTRNKSDPTFDSVSKRYLYTNRLEQVESSAKETDPFLADYILKAVTLGRSYEYLQTCLNIPCSRDIYYELYRKFFWILSNKHA